jgi:DNA-binding CsgD family transcriptional regulator
MEPLGSRDMMRFSKMLWQLYRPATISSLPGRLVAMLGAVLANCNVAIDDIDLDRRISKRQVCSVPAQFEQRSPKNNPAEVTQISEFITLHRRKADESANAGGANARSEQWIVVMLPGNRHITRLTFLRRRNFSERELKFLKLLSPHLAQAVANTDLSATQKKLTKAAPTAIRRLANTKLTPRELEVLRWVAGGKRNREIGLILSTSSRTIQKQVQSILDKLGVETRCGAAAWWFEHGGRAS